MRGTSRMRVPGQIGGGGVATSPRPGDILDPVAWRQIKSRTAEAEAVRFGDILPACIDSKKVSRKPARSGGFFHMLDGAREGSLLAGNHK
jgi:hypothetical protein